MTTAPGVEDIPTVIYPTPRLLARVGDPENYSTFGVMSLEDYHKSRSVVDSSMSRTTGSGYSIRVACIYVFNLIFGSGALLLPYAFWNVGWLPGSIMFLVLALFSFITCTYVVESMSLACAFSKYPIIASSHPNFDDDQTRDANDAESSLAETEGGLTNSPLVSEVLEPENLFEISQKYEMSDMARMFYGQRMLYVFFGVTILYLYGDLCIYLSVIGMSLTDFTCKGLVNHSNAISDACSRFGTANFFRVYITLFTFSLGMLAFFNVQKTKIVQISTILLRWLAFLLMLSLALYRITLTGSTNTIPVAKASGLAPFFGTVLYAFMCQHSIPSILAPINKRSSSYIYIFAFSLFLALLLYFVLTLTAGIAFGNDILPVYSLNFANMRSGVLFTILGSFLQLFPVVALSSSYPIVCVTLRENIKALVLLPFANKVPAVPLSARSEIYSGTENRFVRRIRQLIHSISMNWFWILSNILIPIFVIIPPFLLLLVLDKHVQMISSLTGSYAGNAMQYVIPTILIICARKKAKNYPRIYSFVQNHHASPFYNKFWISAILSWSLIAGVVVTYSNVNNLIQFMNRNVTVNTMTQH